MNYSTWARQFEQATDCGAFFASDRTAARDIFPIYIQQKLDSSEGLRVFSLSTEDYSVDFQEWDCTFKPSLRVTSRRFSVPSEKYEGSVPELARYAANRLGRTGTKRFALNVVPDTIQHALIKSDDFWHNLFWPVTSSVNRFIDECFE